MDWKRALDGCSAGQCFESGRSFKWCAGYRVPSSRWIFRQHSARPGAASLLHPRVRNERQTPELDTRISVTAHRAWNLRDEKREVDHRHRTQRQRLSWLLAAARLG